MPTNLSIHRVNSITISHLLMTSQTCSDYALFHIQNYAITSYQDYKKILFAQRLLEATNVRSIFISHVWKDGLEIELTQQRLHIFEKRIKLH